MTATGASLLGSGLSSSALGDEAKAGGHTQQGVQRRHERWTADARGMGGLILVPLLPKRSNSTTCVRILGFRTLCLPAFLRKLIVAPFVQHDRLFSLDELTRINQAVIHPGSIAATTNM